MSLVRFSRLNILQKVVGPRMVTTRLMSNNEGSKAGDKLAKKGAADQAQYFRQLERQQLLALKKHHDSEIEEHEADIKRLQERIQQHKERLQQLKDHE